MGQPRLITAQLNRIQCGRRGGLAGALLFFFFSFLLFFPVSFRQRAGAARQCSVFVCVWKKALDGEKAGKDERDLRESPAKPPLVQLTQTSAPTSA